MIPGTSVNGEVLVHDGPWPWKTCRKLCRQYLECLAFKMTWITQERKLGMCTIYRGFIKQSDLVRELETDMYISCPHNLIWDISRDLCHSPSLLGPVKYAEAVKTCRKIYNFNGTSHSTLMVARNENDTAFLNKYAAKKNVWLGIFGPPHARKVGFLYEADKTPVTWTH
ncbi:hypothetical protein LSH36_368g05012 [Paralvinella palmiformis]|uniref:C-type lectin domain-containing protein n=1 Tax=Paralvinella palmiformis TaxID=53620 RepID=A0AAD9JET8_9ANNE|nr:hypothetical protein LSH36_368g05012 [Paralvinella palmiformis]